MMCGMLFVVLFEGGYPKYDNFYELCEKITIFAL